MNGSARATTAAHARRSAAIYILVVLAISWTFEAILIANGGLGAFGSAGIFVLMWIPGAFALILRALRRDEIGLGLRLPSGFRFLAFAYLVPPIVALVAYGVAWSTGLAPLEIPWDRIARKIAPGAGGLAVVVAVAATLGVVTGSIFALGEEIGWRGYLVPLLLRAEVRHPFLTSGFVWAIWHVPLIVFGDYATSELPWVSAAIFTGMVCADSVTLGFLRVASGSFWPAVIMHASHKSFFQGVFDKFTGKSELGPFCVGESGVLPMILYAALAVWIWRSRRLKRALAEYRSSSTSRSTTTESTTTG